MEEKLGGGGEEVQSGAACTPPMCSISYGSYTCIESQTAY